MSSGIHCLVFSRDRAMQLDAFLRSAKMYAPYDSIDVLWHGTYPIDAEGYELLWQPDHFIREFGGSDFEQMFRLWLADRKPERVVFHTDDDVWFRTPDGLVQNVPGPGIDFGSYRLGRNTGYCHPLDCEQEIPAPPWPWRWREAQGDFGYPLCLNGTVYRSADLVPLLEGWHFANPTELEAGLAYRSELFRPEWMTAPFHSCCVSLPHNRVSVSSGCRAGSNPDWQPDELACMYLNGWRIDLDNMDFSDIVGAHQEVPLKFRRGEETC